MAGCRHINASHPPARCSILALVTNVSKAEMGTTRKENGAAGSAPQHTRRDAVCLPLRCVPCSWQYVRITSDGFAPAVRRQGRRAPAVDNRDNVHESLVAVAKKIGLDVAGGSEDSDFVRRGGLGLRPAREWRVQNRTPLALMAPRGAMTSCMTPRITVIPSARVASARPPRILDP